MWRRPNVRNKANQENPLQVTVSWEGEGECVGTQSIMSQDLVTRWWGSGGGGRSLSLFVGSCFSPSSLYLSWGHPWSGAGPSIVRGSLSRSLHPGRNLFVKLLRWQDGAAATPPLSHRKGILQKFHFWVSAEKRGICLPQSFFQLQQKIVFDDVIVLWLHLDCFCYLIWAQLLNKTRCCGGYLVVWLHPTNRLALS